MKSVIRFWQEKKLWLLFLICFSIFNTIVTLLFPYILKDIIDGIKENFQYESLIKYVLILGVLGAVRALCSALLPFFRGRTNETFMLKERNGIFANVTGKGHSFTNRFPAGDVLQRLDHDLRELCWFACSGIFRPFEGIIIIFVALFFLVRINLWLTVLAVIPMTLAIVGWLKISPLMYKYYHRWRDTIAKVNNHLQSSFAGIKLVKAYTMEKKNHLRFVTLLRTRIQAAVKVIQIEALIHTLFTAIQEIGIIFILLFGGIFILRGTLTIGEFVAFNAYILLLLGPMIRIGNFFVSRKRAQVQNERLEQIKDFPADITEADQLQRITSLDIELNGVSFRYAKNAPDVLTNVTVALPHCKKIGLAGTVGSGKTTLIKLLMRFADPYCGSVSIGGSKIKNIPLSRLRECIRYVPQEPSLFSDTIKNNILFGRTYDEQTLKRAIRFAQLEEFIETQNKGLEERIGERGLKLSGGEKQRIAIARAIYAQPQILILDDATSNLDADTEKNLIHQLSRSLHVSILIVSHRLSILASCDFIYVLDRGCVVEQGTHTTLLSNRGLYWKLYQHQIAEEKLENI